MQSIQTELTHHIVKQKQVTTNGIFVRNSTSPTPKKKKMSKLREAHTPIDISAPPLSSVFCRGVRIGIVSSRSGYESAENRQNGADAPILSLLNAIY
jgi:hypothetical protein